MSKKDIVSCDYEEVRKEIEELGEKPFRAGQVYAWLHERQAGSFEEMTDLSRGLRERLEEGYEIARMDVEARQVSETDGTEKFLFGLSGGSCIESVLMRHPYGNSVCISSQAGCRMGCRFCASATDGLKRNLSVSEMLRQVYQIQRITKERVSHVVVMGIGEPLDNYDNFVKCIRMLSDGHGLRISQRRITASTCGIVPGILKLAEEGLQITLALSLHGSTQEKRESLMPAAKKYKLSEVMSACGTYFRKTGRRVTFEYSLMAGVNDGEEDVRGLVSLLGKRGAHLNLIPVNPVAGRGYKKPDRKKAAEFQNKLEKSGINVTIRRERGPDIDGACGQLRRRHASG